MGKIDELQLAPLGYLCPSRAPQATPRFRSPIAERFVAQLSSGHDVLVND